MSLKKESKYSGQTIDTPSRQGSDKFCTALKIGFLAVCVVSFGYALSLFGDNSVTVDDLLNDYGYYAPEAYDSFAGQLDTINVDVDEENVDDIEVVGNVGNLIEEYDKAKDAGDNATAKILEEKIIKSIPGLVDASLEIAKSDFPDTQVVIQANGNGVYKFRDSDNKWYTPKGTSKDLVDAIVTVQDCARSNGSGKPSYGIYINNSDANTSELIGYVGDLVVAAQTDAAATHGIEDNWLGDSDFYGTANEQVIGGK